MPTKPIDVKSANVLLLEHCGKWVAWNSDHSRVVAHSDTITELWELVQKSGIEDPVFEKIPRCDVRFVGRR